MLSMINTFDDKDFTRSFSENLAKIAVKYPFVLCCAVDFCLFCFQLNHSQANLIHLKIRKIKLISILHLRRFIMCSFFDKDFYICTGIMFIKAEYHCCRLR